MVPVAADGLTVAVRVTLAPRAAVVGEAVSVVVEAVEPAGRSQKPLQPVSKTVPAIAGGNTRRAHLGNIFINFLLQHLKTIWLELPFRMLPYLYAIAYAWLGPRPLHKPYIYRAS